MTEPTDGGHSATDDGAKGDGTQAADAARNAEAEANRNKLIATLEQNVAAERAEKARLAAELEATRRALTPATPETADPLEAARETARKLATGSVDSPADPLAPLVLQMADRLEQQARDLEMTQRELGHALRLQKYGDEDVEREFQKNRHLYGTVDAAREVVEGRRAKEREAKLKEELETTRAALAASQNRLNPNHVRTHAPAEVTAVELKARMTQAEWTERQKELERQADAGDEKARRTMYAEQMKLRKGEVVVER